MRKLLILAACVAISACTGLSSNAVPNPHSTGQTGLNVSPSTLSMGPSDLASVSVSDPGFTGTFSATTSDATVATVASNGPAQFIVSAIAPGTCTVTISDGAGHAVPVA